MTVHIRLAGPPSELHAVREQLHQALGPRIRIDATRDAREGERWYGEIDVPPRAPWTEEGPR